jgi:hypothetical protein
MVLKISFAVFILSLWTAGLFPNHQEIVAQVILWSFMICFYSVIFRCFRRRTVNVVIIEDRTKH